MQHLLCEFSFYSILHDFSLFRSFFICFSIAVILFLSNAKPNKCEKRYPSADSHSLAATIFFFAIVSTVFVLPASIQIRASISRLKNLYSLEFLCQHFINGLKHSFFINVFQCFESEYDIIHAASSGCSRAGSIR